MQYQYPHVAKAWEWADGVLNGDILACKYIKLACQRFFDDLERDDIEMDYKEAERFCKFVEQLPHVKGRWASLGETIKLEPWQCFKFVNIFGLMKIQPDGSKKRKYSEVYGEVPRKNGKSIDAAAVGLFMVSLDGEYGSEVYCGATSEKQANEVFMPANRMLKRDKELREFLDLEALSKSIFRESDNSFFQRVIGNPPDGTSPHCGIVDEYHEHKHDAVYKTFQTGMGARENPLLYVITTAGDNIGGPCHEKRQECIQILEGILNDSHADSTFVFIFTIDTDDDDFWKTEEALRMANPNFDVSVSGEWLKKQQAQAIRSVKDQGAFKTKHLNIWVAQTEPFINYEDWKKCADPEMKLEDYAMYPMKLGVDLSSRIDFTSSCKVFYWDDPNDGKRHYALFAQNWLPEALKEEYEAWVDHITWTEGDEIDTLAVKRQLKSDMENFMCEEVVFDPWKSAGFEQELDGHGMAEIVRFPQTVGQFTSPMNEFEAAIVSGRLHHNDDPVLNWMLSNLHAKRDTNGNVKPRKEDKKKKIDAIVAAIMGVGRSMQNEEEDFSAEIIVL